MTHASSKRGQVVAHRGCFANLLALVGASMDPSLRGADDLLHPFALLRETRPSRNTCPPPDASHRRRPRLLYLQRTRAVRAPHHRKPVAVAIPVAQSEAVAAPTAAGLVETRHLAHLAVDPHADVSLDPHHSPGPIGGGANGP